MSLHLIFNTTAPAAAPAKEGVHWIDTVAKRAWLSVGTASVADWVEQKEATWAGLAGVPGDSAALLEFIQDTVGAAITQGTGINVAYNDTTGAVTISALAQGLTVSANNPADTPVTDAAVTELDFDAVQFEVDLLGDGYAPIALRPSFLATLGGGGADRYPVWDRSASGIIVPGAAASVGSTLVAMSPGFTANRTWAIPFMVTQACTLNDVAMSLGGTIPAGNMEFSIQPFPSNPETPDTNITYSQVFAYTTLINYNPQTLTTPQSLAPGLYMLYVRCSAAAASMTTRQITTLGTAHNTIVDPLTMMMSGFDILGSCALTRTYSVALDTTQLPHPFDDGTAVAASTAPVVRLGVTWVP